ncbi:hypothetical protein [Nocardioides sp.]|uniref:hypothetical protein n=1 Tax=Nocardioides sp. TaxID=35761 RepID=UPI0035673532
MNLDALRGLTQPDQRSCGPSSLVAARMLIDPAYAPDSFDTEVLALHRQVTAAASFGRAQLPWPRALGTPPWALARAMTSFSGLPYRTRLARWGDRNPEFEAVHAAVTAGHPCPLYVGDRWLPRHVVLAAAPLETGVRVYDPARGALTDLNREVFESGALTTFGRWARPWFVVAPRD